VLNIHNRRYANGMTWYIFENIISKFMLRGKLRIEANYSSAWKDSGDELITNLNFDKLTA